MVKNECTRIWDKLAVCYVHSACCMAHAEIVVYHGKFLATCEKCGKLMYFCSAEGHFSDKEKKALKAAGVLPKGA